MINVTDKKDCCGCGACFQSCPQTCITLESDNEGFLYPNVDESKCINCGLCERVCPVQKPYNARTPLHTYAAINPNEEIRMESSSGGVFTLLAETVIIQGGVVFGARYDSDWQVVLDYAESIEGLAAFRGSKYVQARTENTFAQCAQFLKDGRKVLFSGAPCQIAGLKHSLRRDYDNLLTVDFLCHGVPSPKVWAEYLKEVVSIANLNGVSMRDKCEGWKRFNFVLNSQRDGNTCTLSSWHQKNDFMNAFLKNMILRPSCYACRSKEFRSNSDITIADFWGVHSFLPEMDDDKGTSLVMINTEKGEKVFHQYDIKRQEVTFADAYIRNEGFKNATEWPRREAFFSSLDTVDSVISLIRLMLRPTPAMKMKGYIRSIGRLPKRIVKKIFNTIGGG